MTSTIRDLTELLAVAPDDYILISDTSDVVNRDKRISKLNFSGGVMTGGGGVATGGFTLTVPATGIAALKSGTPVAGRVAGWLDANTVQDGGFAVSDIARLSGNAFNWLILGETGVAIAGDAITPTSTMMRVDTEGSAPTDNLASIGAGPADGAILILRSNNGSRDTTIKNGTGTAGVNNIRTSGGVDRLLGTTRERWMAQYYAAAQIWVEISYSNNAA